LVGEAAALAARVATTDEALTKLESLVVSEEMKTRFAVSRSALAADSTVAEFAFEIGCGQGVSGFAPNTLAAVLYAWLRHRGHFEAAILSVIQCGGDTDTVAAITGGICGADVGEEGIPCEWFNGICDWPRSIDPIRLIADGLATGTSKAPKISWPFVLLRNLLFLVVVLFHRLAKCRFCEVSFQAQMCVDGLSKGLPLRGNGSFFQQL